MENEKAYVIIRGCYSDQEVIGVCFDKELADAYAEVSGINEVCSVEEIDIITDKSFIADAQKLVIENEIIYAYDRGSLVIKSVYRHKCFTDDTTTKVSEFVKNSGQYQVFVYGDKEDDVVRKIGFDAMYKYLAENMNL